MLAIADCVLRGVRGEDVEVGAAGIEVAGGAFAGASTAVARGAEGGRGVGETEIDVVVAECALYVFRLCSEGSLRT